MTPVLLSLGSNLGNRLRNLREGVDRLHPFVRIARISSVYETDPLGATAGSPQFLNLVVAGITRCSPFEILDGLLAIEVAMGRRRRQINAPRLIDLDLILYDATLARTKRLTLPHPRFRGREFVLAPLRELELTWVDPASGVPLQTMRGEGKVVRVGGLFS